MPPTDRHGSDRSENTAAGEDGGRSGDEGRSGFGGEGRGRSGNEGGGRSGDEERSGSGGEGRGRLGNEGRPGFGGAGVLRRDLLRAGTTVGTLAVAGCLGGAPGEGFDESFEGGLGDWESGAAIGPEVEIEAFEWEFSVSDAEANSGDRSLRIWNEGDYDDGVTWGVHPVPVTAGRAYDVTVTAQFWSESESFNTLRDAVMRLGPEPPDVEEDFPHPGLNTTALGETPYGGLREPLWLSDGWREYRFEWTTPELSTDTLYIALGHAVIWEGDATHFIDDISIRFAER